MKHWLKSDTRTHRDSQQPHGIGSTVILCCRLGNRDRGIEEFIQHHRTSTVWRVSFKPKFDSKASFGLVFTLCHIPGDQPKGYTLQHQSGISNLETGHWTRTQPPARIQERFPWPPHPRTLPLASQPWATHWLTRVENVCLFRVGMDRLFLGFRALSVFMCTQRLKLHSQM